MGKALLILVFTMFLGACSTVSKTEVEEFKGVKNGMDKSEVLDILGSPKTSYHADGKDVWNYEIHEKDNMFRREIHFQKGLVTYNGKSSLDAADRQISSDKKEAKDSEKKKEDKEFKEYKKSINEKSSDKDFKEVK